MANSPTCSSTSPSTSTATGDLQEVDGLSDDSGVDVKLQSKNPHQHQEFLKFRGEQCEAAVECNSKRNKRKSSEPKKRKDVLQMKRFRWDTDDEDYNEVEDSRDDVFERERPSSGDSGCQIPSTSTSNLPKVPSAEDKKKRTSRQWRKSKLDKEGSTSHLKQEGVFRQSVIHKHEASSSAAMHDHSLQDFPGTPLLADAGCSPASTSGQTFVPPLDHSLEFDLVEDSSPGSSRMVGRPRNYKGMSRQRRIEANARERTRVHTISAAFENLRRAVPAYAHNQKLSKLAILRIASAYIVALACLSEQDCSQETPQPDLPDCVEQCTRTIQAEGRSRRRTSKD